MASGVFPLLNVANLDKSVEWYERLGLDVKEETDEEGTRWARVASGDGALALFPRDWPGATDEARAWATGDVGRGVLHILGVANAKRLWDKAQAAGAAVDEPLEDQPWGGQGFTVVDPDGYVLMVVDRLPGQLGRRPAKKLAARTARRSAKKATKRSAKTTPKKTAKKRATTKRTATRSTKKRRR